MKTMDECKHQWVVNEKFDYYWGCSICGRVATKQQAEVFGVPLGELRKMIETKNFDFADYIRDYRDWSYKTFGGGERLEPVLKHIRKELNEIEENPKDIFEWGDVIMLTLIGATRQGFEPEDIIAALIEKRKLIEDRTWTEGEDGVTEHVRN